MKKIIITGFFSSVLSLILGMATGYTVLITYLSGGIGLGSLLIACLLTGVFISGDKMRGNYGTESNDTRQKRTRIMFKFVIFGVPHFIVSIILTLYFT